MRKAEVVGEELAWWKFILPADEFFITYAMPASGPEVALFLVGHCAELYHPGRHREHRKMSKGKL